MAEMKARHAFGSLANVDQAITDGKIDAYDILFLKDGDVARVGWIDKNGQKVIVEDKNQIVHVQELPIENGDTNVVYIFENQGYIWNSEQNKCIPLVPKDMSDNVTELGTKVTTLENSIKDKVDGSTVDQKITDALASYEASYEVVEF